MKAKIGNPRKDGKSFQTSRRKAFSQNGLSIFTKKGRKFLLERLSNLQKKMLMWKTRMKFGMATLKDGQSAQKYFIGFEKACDT